MDTTYTPHFGQTHMLSPVVFPDSLPFSMTRSLRLLPRNFGEIVELKGGHRYSTTMAAWQGSPDVKHCNMM
jgi:hypothetical protein